MEQIKLDNYHVYLTEVVNYWKKYKTLSGFSKITKKHHVKGITKEIFFLHGLDKLDEVPRELSDKIRLFVSQIDAERKLKNRQDKECLPSDEPLNKYIPIEAIYPYLLRDYRAEQKKVAQLRNEILEVRQKKNDEIKKLQDKLSTFEKFNINEFRQLQIDYKELSEEVNRYKAVIIRIQGILGGQGLNNFLIKTLNHESKN
jgi:hypothetical protein